MEFTVPDDIFGTENCYSGQTGGVQSEPDTNLSGRSGRTWEEVGSDGSNPSSAVVLWAQATLIITALPRSRVFHVPVFSPFISFNVRTNLRLTLDLDMITSIQHALGDFDLRALMTYINLDHMIQIITFDCVESPSRSSIDTKR